MTLRNRQFRNAFTLHENRTAAHVTAALLLVLAVALLTGCRLLRAPQAVVNTVAPGNRDAPPDPLQLQGQIERFTDNFSMQTGLALDDYARKTGTESARIEALILLRFQAETNSGRVSAWQDHVELIHSL